MYTALIVYTVLIVYTEKKLSSGLIVFLWTGLHGTFGVPTVDESTAYLQREMWYLKMKFHEDERDESVPLTASPFHRSKSSLTAETTLRAAVAAS